MSSIVSINFGTLDSWSAIAAFASLFSAFLALLAIRQNTKNNKNVAVQNVLQKFFDVHAEIRKTNSKDRTAHELLGNYFEYIAWLIEKGHISIQDVAILETELLKEWEMYGTDYQDRNGPEYYGSWSRLVAKLRGKNN